MVQTGPSRHNPRFLPFPIPSSLASSPAETAAVFCGNATKFRGVTGGSSDGFMVQYDAPFGLVAEERSPCIHAFEDGGGYSCDGSYIGATVLGRGTLLYSGKSARCYVIARRESQLPGVRA